MFQTLKIVFPLTQSTNVLFQVDQLSAEIHERKKKDKDRVDIETQTEEYVWTETGVLFSYVYWFEIDNYFCLSEN